MGFRLNGCAFLVLVVAGGGVLTEAFRSIRTPPTRRPSWSLNAFALTTALESVSEENEVSRAIVQWMSVSEVGEHEDCVTVVLQDNNDTSSTTMDNSTTLFERLPLYPLSATYLPTGNHTLRNTEPRNLKMAMDLQEGGRFCVVLCAADTGRIATVGTVLEIASLEPHYDAATDQLVRIIVTCRSSIGCSSSSSSSSCSSSNVPEPELVDVLGIENPQAASWENRLRKSDEYLVARVRRRQRRQQCDDNDDDNSRKQQQLVNGNENSRERLLQSEITDNYQAVRNLYLQGVGTKDLPPFTRDQLSLLPDWTTLNNDYSTTSSSSSSTKENMFWQMAQDWQSLCYTIREGRQIALASDRNECMVSAALKKGGALKLPVHLEDLEPADRQEVQRLEVQAQQAWLDTRLDPCVDFQVLLTLKQHSDRLQHLAGMIRRERSRLETILNEEKEQQVANMVSDVDAFVSEPDVPRKGAWFDDSRW